MGPRWSQVWDELKKKDSSFLHALNESNIKKGLPRIHTHTFFNKYNKTKVNHAYKNGVILEEYVHLKVDIKWYFVTSHRFFFMNVVALALLLVWEAIKWLKMITNNPNLEEVLDFVNFKVWMTTSG